LRWQAGKRISKPFRDKKGGEKGRGVYFSAGGVQKRVKLGGNWLEATRGWGGRKKGRTSRISGRRRAGQRGFFSGSGQLDKI